MRRALAALVLALALAGCGGGAAPGAGGGPGSAELWVTRDRGARVLLAETVPAGRSVIQALDAVADVKTRYGGRYVQAIDGVEGSLAGQRDWFFFVNGIEPDVGAAEVRLRPGDVAWWDFRSWRGRMDEPVVVGAFPEPFLHGWNGRVRPVEVRAPQELAGAAARLRELLGPGGAGGEPNVFVLVVGPGDGALLTATRGPANGAPVTFTLSGPAAAVRAAALALAADPSIVRYRYTARFDAQGRLVG